MIYLHKLAVFLFFIALHIECSAEEPVVSVGDRYYYYSIIERLSKMPSELNMDKFSEQQKEELVEIVFTHWYLIHHLNLFCQNEAMDHSLKKRIKKLDLKNVFSLAEVYRTKKFNLELKVLRDVRILPLREVDLNEDKSAKLLMEFNKWVGS